MSPEGEFSPPPNPAIAYASLIGERVLSVMHSSSNIFNRNIFNVEIHILTFNFNCFNVGLSEVCELKDVQVPGSVDIVSQALAITVRYGAVRKQGPLDPKILDYPAFQYRLMPLVAQLYATHATWR